MSVLLFPELPRIQSNRAAATAAAGLMTMGNLYTIQTPRQPWVHAVHYKHQVKDEVYKRQVIKLHVAQIFENLREIEIDFIFHFLCQRRLVPNLVPPPNIIDHACSRSCS